MSEKKMRISFDLDEVLFVSPIDHETEPPLRFPFNRIYRERLRKGTVELIHELQRRDFEVWVYTSSFRTRSYIKGLFRHYGIRFSDIINGYRHAKEIQTGRTVTLPNKLPSRYRISLHIDDEEIVCKTARQYGFNVFWLKDHNPCWQEEILERAETIRKRETQMGLL